MSALPPIVPQTNTAKSGRPATKLEDHRESAGFEDLLANVEVGLSAPKHSSPPPPPVSREELAERGADRPEQADPSSKGRPDDAPSANQERQAVEAERQDEPAAKTEESPADDSGPAFVEEDLVDGETGDEAGGDELTTPASTDSRGKGNAPRFRIASTGVVTGLQGARATVASMPTQSPAQLEAQAVRLESLIRDLTDTAHLRMLKQGREIRVRLNPPDLGRLAMQIRSDDDGIRAVIRVENEAARSALEARAEDLKQELARQGIELKDVDVAVGSGVFSSQSDSSDEANQDVAPLDGETHQTTNHSALRSERASQRAHERGGFDFRA